MSSTIFTCPHCQLPVEVKHSDINCTIFRHGSFVQSMKEVDEDVVDEYKLLLKTDVRDIPQLQALKNLFERVTRSHLWGSPINPHAREPECDLLRKSYLVRGCCQPFRFDGRQVVKCGYET
jgi:hypothetical protein